MITQNQKDKCLELIPELEFKSDDFGLVAILRGETLTIKYQHIKDVCDILNVYDITIESTSVGDFYMYFYHKETKN